MVNATKMPFRWNEYLKCPKSKRFVCQQIIVYAEKSRVATAAFIDRMYGFPMRGVSPGHIGAAPPVGANAPLLPFISHLL